MISAISRLRTLRRTARFLKTFLGNPTTRVPPLIVPLSAFLRVRPARLFEYLRYLSDTHAPWERVRLVTVVRAIVVPFGVANSVLERLYRAVSRTAIDEPAVAEWESSKERYNLLRNTCERYSERMFAVTGL